MEASFSLGLEKLLLSILLSHSLESSDGSLNYHANQLVAPHYHSYQVHLENRNLYQPPDKLTLEENIY